MPARKFLQSYLWITLAYGLLGLVDTALSSFGANTNRFYQNILSVFTVLFFFFNLLALSVFKHQRVEKIAYILPLYHLLAFLLFSGIIFWLELRSITSAWIPPTLTAVTGILSFAEMAFSAYLLKKLELV